MRQAITTTTTTKNPQRSLDATNNFETVKGEKKNRVNWNELNENE
jgi:hypothetical protein